LDALAGRRAAAEIARAQAAVAVQAELDDLRAQRAASGGVVPADLLADYDRLRVRGGGIGAARLVGAQCGGCHLTLPSMELDRVRHAPPDAV
ncbi:zinc ribbon domain-containing protein, partial [Staphylococcus aureus]